MMRGRIIDLQRRIREIGRIRIGYSTPAKRSGAKVPHKLDRFRFTAADPAVIDAIAQLYGGEPEPWADGGRDEHQVITTARSIPVAFPTAMGFSQSYEQWAKGFCLRRCDGERSVAPGNKRLVEEPCACDPSDRDCQLTTNLSLILPELPGLGVWRLVSHGWYAATELAGAVDLIEAATATGYRLPARLGVDQREVRRLVDGKAEVYRFVVPTLDLQLSPGALGIGRHPAGGNVPLAGEAEAPALEAAPTWTPVDVAALPEAPTVSIADQYAEANRPPKRRSNARPEVRRTGLTPRKAADVPDNRCDRCGEGYGTVPLARNPEPGGSRFVHRACLDEDPAASQEQDVTGRDGPPSDGTAAAEPIPAGRRRPMTHGQHNLLFALAGEVFADLSDDERRAETLALATALGTFGLKSRTEIDTDTASKLIDALRAVRDGDYQWADGALVEVATGRTVAELPL
jgi:hypothetical protein